MPGQNGRPHLLRKVLSGSGPKYRRKNELERSVMNPYEEMIKGWLSEEQSVHPKLRHMGKRIYHRLVEECVVLRGESSVRAYLRMTKGEIGSRTKSLTSSLCLVKLANIVSQKMEASMVKVVDAVIILSILGILAMNSQLKERLSNTGIFDKTHFIDCRVNNIQCCSLGPSCTVFVWGEREECGIDFGICVAPTLVCEIDPFVAQTTCEMLCHDMCSLCGF